MKDLKKLKGVKMLSKMEQKSIKGGIAEPCEFDSDCTPTHFCPAGWCVWRV